MARRLSPVELISAFLRGIGLEVIAADVGDDTILPGIATRDGRLIVDVDRLKYPGDLLQEAGHLAVLGSAARRRFGSEGGDAGLDMQRVELRAIAWSYAAAVHLSSTRAWCSTTAATEAMRRGCAEHSRSVCTPAHPPSRRSD